MPAVMITIVMPMANTAVIEDCSATSSRLSTRMKAGFSQEKTTHRAKSPMMMPDSRPSRPLQGRGDNRSAVLTWG